MWSQIVTTSKKYKAANCDLKKYNMRIIKSIQNRIYEIRGERVMLDFDLAALYEVETRVLNQAIKRNIKRFPKDFMFQLSYEEFENLRFQIEASEKSMSSQFVMTYSKKRPKTALPYAFTEQGVAMNKQFAPGQGLEFLFHPRILVEESLHIGSRPDASFGSQRLV